MGYQFKTSVSTLAETLTVLTKGRGYFYLIQFTLPIADCCPPCLQGLQAANLGDSGFMLMRNGRSIFKSPVQQHQFNIPFQLESGGSDPPSSAEVLFFIYIFVHHSYLLMLMYMDTFTVHSAFWCS